MRMSKQFSQTLREAPADTEVVSNQLLLRAGYIRQLAAGIYSYLPFAKRSIRKIEQIMREEMDGIGGQEITMPVVQPASIWKKTGRWFDIGTEMGRFQDKNGRDMVLAMTSEEVVADLARGEIQSHKQLPQMIYHMQTKWRDDPRPRAGLIRVREFTMLDSYSLDADLESLDKIYDAHYDAYFRIFKRLGLPAIAVASDTGMMGGSMAHEYMYLSPIGEDTLLLCDVCDYSANRQIADFRKPEIVAEEQLPMEKVATPDMKTIAGLAKFLNIPESKTAKAVFMIATITEKKKDVDKFVFAIVRGDTDLNETKLANKVGATDMRPATPEEIIAIGATPGYASPIGLSNDSFILVIDDLAAASANLAAGANDAGYHYINSNYGRDFDGGIVTDIAAAREGDGCIECGNALRESRGVEIGNIFKLGTRYTEKMGATFTAKDGKAYPLVMGSYGIGVGRALACVAEERNDDGGLIWPITIAPYEVHIVQMRGGEEAAEQIYADLQAAGVEVLFDDRDAGPGAKFNDADLIGIPLRLTIGGRSLKKGGVEFKRRGRDDVMMLPVDQTVSIMSTMVATMKAELND